MCAIICPEAIIKVYGNNTTVAALPKKARKANTARLRRSCE
jgi:hypothetical protein